MKDRLEGQSLLVSPLPFMSITFDVSACSSDTYAWVIEQGVLQDFDELFRREAWSLHLGSYDRVLALYGAQRGRTFERRDPAPWYGQDDDPLRLALLGGNALIYEKGPPSWENDYPRPLRASSPEDVEASRLVIEALAAAPDLVETRAASDVLGVDASAQRYRDLIETYLQLYRRAEPDEAFFFSVL